MCDTYMFIHFPRFLHSTVVFIFGHHNILFKVFFVRLNCHGWDYRVKGYKNDKVFALGPPITLKRKNRLQEYESTRFLNDLEKLK